MTSSLATIGFFLKKLAASWLLLLPFSLLLLAASLLLVRKHRTKAFVLAGAALVVLFGASTPWVANRLAGSLESRYPPRPPASLHERYDYIVVLGGGIKGIPGRRPATSLLSSSSLARLIEGLRLLMAHPNARLLLSGGMVDRPANEAVVMAEAAMELGVRRQQIIIEKNSRDTREQAENIGRMVGQRPFLLVTSAIHMPRAMLIFQSRGLSPVPAPTDYLVTNSELTGLGRYFSFLPGSFQLTKTERAIHEYLGIFWFKARQKFRPPPTTWLNATLIRRERAHL